MKELNIAVIGGVDCGKSTLLSVLKTNELDDGNGSARLKIAKYRHEIETGRTSAISQHYIKISEDKICCLIDLCGHEQYLKTTIHGMCGYYIDFALIVVGGNLSITEMTKEHLNSCLSLNIPFLVVITKIDMSPPHILNKTKEVIREIMTNKVKMRNVVWMNDDENNINLKNLMKNIPIFCVSNRTGEGIDMLRRYIYSLPVRTQSMREISDGDNDSKIFSIDQFFQVKGVGTVVSGWMIKGMLERNDKMYLGPLNGVFYQVSVRSFHDNFRTPIERMEGGNSGCVCIKSNAKTLDFRQMKHKRGIYLLSESEKNNSINREFEADIIIIGKHSTQISKNYIPIINCKKIVQAAKMMEIYGAEYIRPGEMCRVRFRFEFRPEYIRENDRFIFRESTTRGVGIIRSVGKKTEEEVMTSNA